MAVQFEGGVVIGADSRTTTGSYIVPFFTTLSSACFDHNLLSGQSRHR
jgi:20S proteasome alpha/beta subunit